MEHQLILRKRRKNATQYFFSYFEKKQRFKKVADDGEIDWQVFEMMFRRDKIINLEISIFHTTFEIFAIECE